MKKLYRECAFPTVDARLTDTIHVKGETSVERPTVRAVCADGRVQVLQTKADIGEVNVSGKLFFNCICESEDGNLYSLCGTADFSHTIQCEEANSETSPVCFAQLCEININSFENKLIINADIDLFCRIENNSTVRMLCEGEDVETLQVTVSNMDRECVGETSQYVREDIVTGKISDVVYADATAVIRDITAVVDTARVDGILNLNALCYSRESGYVHLKQNIPFSIDVETKYDNCRNISGICDVSDVRLRITEDEYGLAALDAQIHVMLYAKAEAPVCYCADAYSPTEPFDCTKKKMQIILFRDTAMQKTSVRSVLHIDNMQEYAEGIFAFARPYVSSAEKIGTDVNAQGLLNVTLLYKIKSGDILSANDTIPFTLKMPVEYENAEIDAFPVCTSVNIGSPGDKGVEISVSMSSTADMYELCDAEIVTDTVPKAKNPAPSSFIICFAGEGETSYEIAKEFGISKKSLAETNPDLSDNLKAGDKAVILR